jgi:hypothetical protein
VEGEEDEEGDGGGLDDDASGGAEGMVVVLGIVAAEVAFLAFKPTFRFGRLVAEICAVDKQYSMQVRVQ